MGDGERLRRHAAHGMTGDDRVPGVQVLEHGGHVGAEGFDRQSVAAGARRAVPALVVEDDSVAALDEQPGGGRPDSAVVGPAVHEHERVPVVVGSGQGGRELTAVGRRDADVGAVRDGQPGRGVGVVGGGPPPGGEHGAGRGTSRSCRACGQGQLEQTRLLHLRSSGPTRGPSSR